VPSISKNKKVSPIASPAARKKPASERAFRSHLFGEFVKYSALSDTDRSLVDLAFQASANAYCPHSRFPVGSALWALNEQGAPKVFPGCNVENFSLTATICAERSAAMAAVSEGYRTFKTMAVVASSDDPGGSPCGMCRQAMCELGPDGELLLVVDTERNVRRGPMRSLLPIPAGARVKFDDLREDEKTVVQEVMSDPKASYVPYTHVPRQVVVRAKNATGEERTFKGVHVDFACYSGSITATCAAIASAVSKGFTRIETLALHGVDRLDGHSLQALREFDAQAEVIFVAKDKSVIRSNIDELLPGSFGPEKLGRWL
jgi:cytidine deaminase